MGQLMVDVTALVWELVSRLLPWRLSQGGIDYGCCVSKARVSSRFRLGEGGFWRVE